jgi:histidine triad (HIT) family protein
MTDCIFCKIVAGEIPSTKIHETDRCLAFMDINPLTIGHALLIPKDHHETVMDMPDDLLGELIVAAKHLAGVMVNALDAGGINLLQSNGRTANQIIPHYHMHLVPRYDEFELKGMAWELKPGDLQEIGAVAEKIRKAL